MGIKVSIPRTPEIFLVESKANKRFRLRYVGWTGFFYPLAMLGLFLLFLLVPPRFPDPHAPKLAILCGCGFVLSLLIFMGIYSQAGKFTPIRAWNLFGFIDVLLQDSGLKPYKPGDSNEIDHPQVEIDFSLEGFGVSVDRSDFVTISWKNVSIVWQFPDCWMLILDLQKFVPIPTCVLDEPCRNLIVEQVRQKRGKIQANPGLGLGLMFTRKIF